VNKNYVPIVDVKFLERLPFKISCIVEVFAQCSILKVSSTQSVEVVFRLTNFAKLTEGINCNSDPDEPVGWPLDAYKIHFVYYSIVEIINNWVILTQDWIESGFSGESVWTVEARYVDVVPWRYIDLRPSVAARTRLCGTTHWVKINAPPARQHTKKINPSRDRGYQLDELRTSTAYFPQTSFHF